MPAITSPSSNLLLGVLFSLAITLVYRKISLYLVRRKLIRELNPQPPAKYPHKDPFFGLDEIRDAARAGQSHRYLDRIRDLYATHGNTFSASVLARSVINTIEPDNIKAVLSSQFKNFAIGAPRRNAFSPLIGHSIVVSDGAQWKHSRALLQPSFARNQVDDLHIFEIHTRNLIQAILQGGSIVDLKELFFRFTADVTSDFMFGESLQLLSKPSASQQGFMEDFHEAQLGAEIRMRRGKLANWIPQPNFYKSIKRVHEFIDQYVARALEYRHKFDLQQQQKSTSELVRDQPRHVFLHEIAKATDDRQVLRNELLTVFFAGRDTTASLLSNIFFMIARRPDIWQKLRTEVEFLNKKKPTANQLKEMKYLRSCIDESLRIHPAIPTNSRIALHDTILPLGGGSDGKSPIFVPAGTMIAFHVSALHQRIDLWGEDASEFRPERWLTEKPSWKYLPFSAGPRVCIGQHFALTEASYAIVRLVQHFTTVTSCDPEPWKECLGVTYNSGNGVKVGLTAEENVSLE